LNDQEETGSPDGKVALKFQYDPRYHERLRKAPWLKALESGRSYARALDTVYFDTPDNALHREGVALHVDRNGKRSPKPPPLSALQNDPKLRKVVSKRVFDSLQPVFATHIRRVTRHLKPSEGTEVALDFDDISVSSNGTKTAGMRELVLTSNDAHALYRMGRLIAATLPVRLISGSLSERALDLLEGRQPTFIKAAPAKLPKSSTSEEALIAIVASCLDHLTANEACAVAMSDPEGVHQMRVALRRLDASLTVYRKLIPDGQRRRLKRRIKGVAEALGPARDWDVFIEDVVRPVAADLPSDDDLLLLRGAAAQQRAIEYRKVRRVLAAQPYTEMRLDLAAWVNEREWRQQSVTKSSARLMARADTFGKAILDKGHGKLTKRGRSLAMMNAAERHQLRIQVKKMRYAGEFFASLFPRRKSERYLHALRVLQDDLGRLNDIEVAHKLIANLATHDRARDRKVARAGGLVLGWHAHAAAAREEKLAEHWAAFKEAKPFWR
jgi:triphosphatase